MGILGAGGYLVVVSVSGRHLWGATACSQAAVWAFTLRESPQRLRVIGEVTTQPTAAAAKVLLPLGTAQKLFHTKGFLSHLVVEPAERVEQVKEQLAGT